LGLGPSFIDEDEAGRINLSLMPFPACPSARDVGPVLLGWQQRFFEAEALALEEPPDRANPDRNVAIREPLLDFAQSQIRLGRDQLQKP
jgi:hypothetical protein